jgi:hypothetical protein
LPGWLGPSLAPTIQKWSFNIFQHEGKYEFIQSSNSTQKKLVNWSPIIAFVKGWKETNRSFAAQTSRCVAYYPSFIMSGDQWATKHQTSKPHVSLTPSPGDDPSHLKSTSISRRRL